MAISLNIPPVALTDPSAINPLTGRATTSATALSRAAVADSTSSLVRLSALGRFLAATPTTATPPATTVASTANAAAVTTAAPAGLENADALAAAQSTSAATAALQTLIDDPQLRALANNQFNPVYSALIAAAHQADFIAREAVTRADAIAVDIPAPVRPVTPSEAVSNHIQAAREFLFQRMQEMSGMTG
ncbi:MAG TPA: hypothetical protein VK165_18185 [Azonexus sp.]|nr:hypothetical protein [Azonexus sp.]